MEMNEDAESELERQECVGACFQLFSRSLLACPQTLIGKAGRWKAERRQE